MFLWPDSNLASNGMDAKNHGGNRIAAIADKTHLASERFGSFTVDRTFSPTLAVVSVSEYLFGTAERSKCRQICHRKNVRAIALLCLSLQSCLGTRTAKPISIWVFNWFAPPPPFLIENYDWLFGLWNLRIGKLCHPIWAGWCTAVKVWCLI